MFRQHSSWYADGFSFLLEHFQDPFVVSHLFPKHQHTGHEVGSSPSPTGRGCRQAGEGSVRVRSSKFTRTLSSTPLPVGEGLIQGRLGSPRTALREPLAIEANTTCLRTSHQRKLCFFRAIARCECSGSYICRRFESCPARPVAQRVEQWIPHHLSRVAVPIFGLAVNARWNYMLPKPGSWVRVPPALLIPG